MGFDDLSKFFTPGLALPIRGKTYTIPAPTAEEGLRIKLSFDNNLKMSDTTELEQIMRLLGAEWVPNEVDVPVIDAKDNIVVDDDGNPVMRTVDQGTYVGGIYSEMAADGLSWEEIMHAGRTALLDAGVGRTLAEVHWQTGLRGQGNPMPPEPGVNRKSRRAAAKKAAPRKAATSKASGGRTRASRVRTATTTPAVEPTIPTPE